jgi:hypothetical protein
MSTPSIAPSIAPSVETRNDTITQSSAPESTDLYQSIRMQNQQIDNESANMRDSYSTDKQRIKYMNYNIINWNRLNFYLWSVYYIIVIVIYYLFIKGEIELKKNSKIYIAILLFIYPFLISSVELIIYNFFYFLYTVIIGIPYPKNTDDQPYFSVFNGLPSLYY